MFFSEDPPSRQNISPQKIFNDSDIFIDFGTLFQSRIRTPAEFSCSMLWLQRREDSNCIFKRTNGARASDCF